MRTLRLALPAEKDQFRDGLTGIFGKGVPLWSLVVPSQGNPGNFVVPVVDVAELVAFLPAQLQAAQRAMSAADARSLLGAAASFVREASFGAL